MKGMREGRGKMTRREGQRKRSEKRDRTEEKPSTSVPMSPMGISLENLDYFSWPLYGML